MDLQKDIANNPTIFGKILRGEIPADKVYEDEVCLAFKDIRPHKKVHIVFISKKHIKSLADARFEDSIILGHMMAKVHEIAKSQGILTSGFRVISNSGVDSGQEVPHLHFHILGGEPVGPLTC